MLATVRWTLMKLMLQHEAVDSDCSSQIQRLDYERRITPEAPVGSSEAPQAFVLQHIRKHVQK